MLEGSLQCSYWGSRTFIGVVWWRRLVHCGCCPQKRLMSLWKELAWLCELGCYCGKRPSWSLPLSVLLSCCGSFPHIVPTIMAQWWPQWDPSRVWLGRGCPIKNILAKELRNSFNLRLSCSQTVSFPIENNFIHFIIEKKWRG